MENSKKKYSERWTSEEEKNLLQTRIRLDCEFQSKNANSRHCWEKVMKEAGIKKTYQSGTQKWQNMLKKYKKMIQPPSGISTESGHLLPTQWELFDELHDFLRTKHGVIPAYLIDENTTQNRYTEETTSPGSSNSSFPRNSSPMPDWMEISSESDDVQVAGNSGNTTKIQSKNSELLEVLRETSEEVKKSARNLEKLVSFATKQMFPDVEFPELE